MDLHGKRALVTGGASGIGAATCRRLRELGAEVVIADVDASAGASLAGELGGRFVELDVTSSAAWSAFVRDTEPIDIAHLNAGVMTRPRGAALLDDPWPWMTEPGYRKVMSVNCDGVFHGIVALVPHMEARGGGQIVVTASIAGVVAQPEDPIYSMSKHAVLGLVRSLGPVVAKKSVALNAVCPGGIDTPLVPSDLREVPTITWSPPSFIADGVVHALSSGLSGEVFIAYRQGQPYWRYVWPDVRTSV